MNILYATTHESNFYTENTAPKNLQQKKEKKMFVSVQNIFWKSSKSFLKHLMDSCKLKCLINFYILSPQVQEIKKKRYLWKFSKKLRKSFEKASK